jgi:hypothetical protein
MGGYLGWTIVLCTLVEAAGWIFHIQQGGGFNHQQY